MVKGCTKHFSVLGLHHARLMPKLCELVHVWLSGFVLFIFSSFYTVYSDVTLDVFGLSSNVSSLFTSRYEGGGELFMINLVGLKRSFKLSNLWLAFHRL